MKLSDIPQAVALREKGFEDFFETDLSSIYRDELKAIKTPKALKDFIHRWRNLYLLGQQLGKNVPLAERELTRRFKFKRLFDKYSRIRKTECAYVGKGKYYAMACCLLVPTALLHATLASRKFGVPPNLVLVQAFQGQDFF